MTRVSKCLLIFVYYHRTSECRAMFVQVVHSR